MPAEDQGLEFDQELEDDETTARPSATPAQAAKAAQPAKPRPAGRKPSADRSRKTSGKARMGLGRGKGKGAPRRERPKVTVQVVGLDRSFQVEEGTDLLAACKTNHVNVFWGPWAQAFNCRGVASCALCKVQVVDGIDNVSPRTKKEEKRLRNRPTDWRLACHAKLLGDVRIDPFPRIPIDEQVSGEAIRRALLTEEEREALRQETRAARLAEREADRDAAPERKQRKSLADRLKGKVAGKKESGDKPDKAKGKGKKGKVQADTGGEAQAETDGGGTKKDKPPKKAFGLKGRK